jgi:hypothetical protein
MTSTATNTRFFWEQRQKGRSRFNLLLLEYGEYFFEDLSANLNSNIQGRLKICSRSVIFEPIDTKRPIVKYPFKYMSTKIRMHDGCIVFDSTCAFELKANNKISPYKQVGSIMLMGQGQGGGMDSGGGVGMDGHDSLLGNLGEATRGGSSGSNNKAGDSTSGNLYSSSDSNNKGTETIRVVLTLLHSDTKETARKMERIRAIHAEVEKRGSGSGAADELLKPMIEQATAFTFDTSQLVDFHEKFLLKEAITLKRIKPLIQNPGLLMVTQARVYFQPAQLNNVGDTMQCIDLSKVSQLYRRRYLLRQTGLEFLLMDGSSTLFAFDSSRDRDRVYSILTSSEIRAGDTSHPHSPVRGSGSHGHSLNGSSNSSSSRGHAAVVADVLGGGAINSVSTDSSSSSSSLQPQQGFKAGPSLEIVTRQWQRREISNFDYLMHLNNAADRSVNDLTQYPVFPHVLTDFESPKLDFSDPSIYRDLSKPMGALNPQRLKYFQKRFKTMPEEDPEMGIPPPFLYGTHYSTPGYVLYYLVRCAPEYMLCLQNGKFDATDRMFHSMRETWESSLTNPTDLKELIPEFFCGTGDFLNNIDDLELGRRHTGDRLDGVELPPWAKRPQDFVRKMRKALESEHVSNHLHLWVDLVFGCKQKGQAAVAANNLYYYLTYEGSVDLEQEKDVRQRAALEAQIQEFGQCPKQLFAAEHPPRNDSDSPLVLVTDSSAGVGGGSAATTGAGGGTNNKNSEAARSSTGITTISAAGAESNHRHAAADVATATYARAGNISANDASGSLQQGDSSIKVLGADFHQEVQASLQKQQQGGTESSSSRGADTEDAAGGSSEEATSPAARLGSIFGSIKGRTASLMDRTGWFGSSSISEKVGASHPPSPDGEDGDDSNKQPVRITSSNYKARVPVDSNTSSANPDRQPASTSTAAAGAGRFRSLQAVDVAHVHDGAVCSVALCSEAAEDGGQMRVVSSGKRDGKLKVMTLGRNTLSISPMGESPLPPGTSFRALAFSKSGESVIALSTGAAEVACMCSYSVSADACNCESMQPLTGGAGANNSPEVSTVYIAGGQLEFKASSSSLSTSDSNKAAAAVSKSFYVLVGGDTGTVSIRSVSHAGALGPVPSAAFIFKTSKPGRVTCCALNCDRVLLAIGTASGALVVVNVETRKEIYSHQCTAGEMVDVLWLQREHLVFASRGGELVVGDVSSGALASSAFGFRNATDLALNLLNCKITCLVCTSSLGEGTAATSNNINNNSSSSQIDTTIVLAGCGDGFIRAFALQSAIREVYVCCSMFFPFFLDCDVSASLLIYYYPPAFSGTTGHESNHHLNIISSLNHSTQYSHYLLLQYRYKVGAHEGAVTHITSSQGIVASGGADGTVRIWKIVKSNH